MIDAYGLRTRDALVKSVGEHVKLRLDFGKAPAAGDELRTPTGRRYLVTSFHGKTISAIVLPADAPPVPGRLLTWWWSSRQRRSPSNRRGR